MPSQHLTANEAAARIGIKAQTLASWRVAGRGPHYIKLSPGARGRVLYEVAAIDEWLQARTFTSTAHATVAGNDGGAR